MKLFCNIHNNTFTGVPKSNMEMFEVHVNNPDFIQLPDYFDPTKHNYDVVKKTVVDLQILTKANIKAIELQSSKDVKLQLALDVSNANNELPVTYKTVQYQADSNSMSALVSKISAVQAGWVVPKTFKWKALDNSLVSFTSQDIKSLYLAIELRNQTNWSKYQTLKTKIKAAKTLTVLNKIKV